MRLRISSSLLSISTIFLEPVLQHLAKKIGETVVGGPLAWRTDIIPLTWVTLAASMVLTVWSGINYLAAYWKYLDPEK